MFLKRRDILAWILLLTSALLWALGQALLIDVSFSEDNTRPSTTPWATTIPSTVSTTDPTGEFFLPSTVSTVDSTIDTTEHYGIHGDNPEMGSNRTYLRAWGMILCMCSAICGLLGIFWTKLEHAFIGPDGATLVLILPFLLPSMYEFDYGMMFLLRLFLIALSVLVSSRELWGWIRVKFDLDWCLCNRIAAASRRHHMTLLVLAGWIGICAACAVYTICRYYYVISPMVWLLFTASGCFGIGCLWRYGLQLHHYDRQLRNFQEGLPIEVRPGAFREAEERLQVIQRQHEEAVRAAITGERFKVELISNVSHDLRTPLTSILGYSELLQQEALSPEGQEQLRRLHLKAGYMNDLVESLFELTKVSSGVIEAKKEEIDLVRLLEQTIGLFDDQLTNAGLMVRRHYESDTVPIMTDGARIHQVFANLLGNAIKYALTGTRIYLEVKETQNSYRIRMMNTSSYEMDFSPEEIMQRFARGDKARSTKGSGLGLAIAQTYTESVGGTFRVAVDGDQFSAIVELPKN